MSNPLPHINNRHKLPTENPDHARRRNPPAPSDTEIEQRLNDLVKPAVFAELAYYRQLGYRSRLLSLPVMVAVVLAMLWRQVPGVCALQRMLARERLLWSEPTPVSQPALSERFLTFPAEVFERVLYAVLEQITPRAAARTHPAPAHLQAVAQRFAHCYGVDGTTLEALFRKLQALQEDPQARLAGHLVVACDLFQHLPQRLWWADDPQTNDKTVLPDLLAWLPPHSLVVFDLGFFAFPFFDALTRAGQAFVTRQRNKTSFRVERVLGAGPAVRDRLVHLGVHRSNPSQHTVRLVEVFVRGRWHAYLTNVLDPAQLSVLEVVALYEQRWGIEQAFLLVKRLLGLSYLWVGSLNGVRLQVWATWLYYAILIDLCADVAEHLQVPLGRISVEMVSRSLYYYVGAVAQGYGGGAAEYFADPANQDLGILKRVRPKRHSLTGEVAALLDAAHSRIST